MGKSISDMPTIVFFLEEPSSKAMLVNILPRLLPGEVDTRIIVFDGKQDMDKSIERKIRSWNLPDSLFFILRDQDSANCISVKQSLQQKVNNTNRSQSTIIRIACHELESFYLGDLAAVEKGLSISGIRQKQDNRKYRNPDNLNNAKQELKALSKNKYQEISGSRNISQYLNLDGSNTSVSFNFLIEAIKTIREQL